MVFFRRRLRSEGIAGSFPGAAPSRFASMSSTVHIPVLAAEAVEWLAPQPGATLVDGTLGGGGHAALLAAAVGDEGRVLALDLDPGALDRATPALVGLPVKTFHSSYVDLPEVLASLDLKEVDGILLDLGLSSDQLADDERGFSFQGDGPLDLRFDANTGEPASSLIASLPEKALADLIYQYGEERLSRRIARRIVERRTETPIETSQQLAQIIRSCFPRTGHRQIDPATRTFQALRIAVNGELDAVAEALRILPDCLRIGGRLAIISFHSLEDRLVKHAFREDGRLRPLSKKPIQPSDEEVARNPRARSAKMRVAERVVAEPEPAMPGGMSRGMPWMNPTR
ncbi:MAG: 16S rRNA (cytosine(1402)-N(4))-methyltransferase RsmH [Planctomycetales bacterium]|nr:16S rRNA (cytosine(1402)-N(4))-methyltransferase RsmH [Planctomycetales bacterium]